MRSAVKGSFIAGLVLVAPLVVTLFVLRIVAVWLLGIVDPVVQGTRLARYTGDVEPAAQVLAALLIVGGITGLGFVARTAAGQRFFGQFGRAVHFVPLVGTIYASVRQVADALVERDSRYESVVLVEYPREGTYVLGFVTSESPDAAVDVVGEPLYNVFLPNSPNPTGGRLLLVPASQVHEIDMSVRRGVRMLVTTGMGTEEELVEPAAR